MVVITTAIIDSGIDFQWYLKLIRFVHNNHSELVKITTVEHYNKNCFFAFDFCEETLGLWRYFLYHHGFPNGTEDSDHNHWATKETKKNNAQ